MENKNSVLVFLLIVVTLGVGYFYFRTDTPPTVPAKNIVSEESISEDLATYSGSSYGKDFSVQYPSSWVHYQFSCNIDGIAFWPKNIAPDLSKLGCALDSQMNAAILIYFNPTPEFAPLKDNQYKDVYEAMKASLILK